MSCEEKGREEISEDSLSSGVGSMAARHNWISCQLAGKVVEMDEVCTHVV